MDRHRNKWLNTNFANVATQQHNTNIADIFMKCSGAQKTQQLTVRRRQKRPQKKLDLAIWQVSQLIVNCNKYLINRGLNPHLEQCTSKYWNNLWPKLYHLYPSNAKLILPATISFPCQIHSNQVSVPTLW